MQCDRDSAPTITGRIFASLMDETLALMDETTAIGEARFAGGHAGPHETAVGLRLAARLARIGAWLAVYAPGDHAAGEVGDGAVDAEVDDRSAASAALQKARSVDLDAGGAHGPIAALYARVDRLTERTLRLDRQLNPSAASSSVSAGASILRFPGLRPATGSAPA